MSTQYYRKGDPNQHTVAVRFAGADNGPLVPRTCFQFFDVLASDEIIVNDNYGSETTIADEIRESVGWFKARRDEHDAMMRASREYQQTQRTATEVVVKVVPSQDPITEMLTAGLKAAMYLALFGGACAAAVLLIAAFVD